MRIEENYDAFVEAFESHPTTIACDDAGNWQTIGFFSRLVRWITGKNDDEKVAKCFSNLLVEIEKNPLQLDNAQDKEKHDKMLKTSKKISSLLQAHNLLDQVKKEHAVLKQNIIALEARYCQESKIVEIDPVLKDMAAKWKAAQNNFKKTTPNEIGLTEKNLTHLLEASSYPDFLKELKESNALKEDFFKALFQYGISPKLYIEFPATYKRLKSCFLISRIASFPKMLEIENRDVKLKFEVAEKGEGDAVYHRIRSVSILNEQKTVVLRNGWERKIKEMFDELKNAGGNETNIDALSGALQNVRFYGLKRWNPGKYNPITKMSGDYESLITSEKWWESIPVYDTWSKDRVIEHFGLNSLGKEGEILNDREGIVGIAASRARCDVKDIIDAHGYFIFAIPSKQEVGKWDIIPFGKFPKKFPDTFMDKLSFVADSVSGGFAIDPNVFYRNRQQAVHPVVVSMEKMEEILLDVGKDLKDSEKGNVTFQMAWKNCAQYVQETAHKHLSHVNYFKGPIGEVRSAGAEGAIFKWISNSPVDSFWYRAKSWIVLTLLGGHRSWHGESLKNGDFVKDFHVFQPGHLFEQILEGKLAGRVDFGNGK